jgi:hypothetical protein
MGNLMNGVAMDHVERDHTQAHRVRAPRPHGRGKIAGGRTDPGNPGD